MRIVSGQYGGRVLKAPKDRSIRPTSDKVRGAIFNALNARGAVDGAQVLDVFCGTGALGLEALSQGAAHCTFIDKNRTSLDLARENAAMLQAENTGFLLKDATKHLERPANISPVSLVFIDPPYSKNLAEPALENLHKAQWVEHGAILVVEEERGLALDLDGSIYSVFNEKTYGDTSVRFLEYIG